MISHQTAYCLMPYTRAGGHCLGGARESSTQSNRLAEMLSLCVPWFPHNPPAQPLRGLPWQELVIPPSLAFRPHCPKMTFTGFVLN